MVSLKSSLTALDKTHQTLDLSVDSYRSLVADLAEYTAGLDNENTAAVRSSLGGIAISVQAARAEDLPQFNLRIRTLLQEYGKRVTTYVANLQQERVRTERVLKELAATLTQADDDHDGRIKKTVDTLRTLSRSPDARAIRDMLSSAAESIEQSVEKIRKDHQYTISQFHNEIRALQRRLGTSEIEGAIDDMLKVYTRAEIQHRITSSPAGQYSVIVLRARGLRLAAVQFSHDVAEQLATAFVIRMRNILPSSTSIARWGEEEFVGLIPAASAASSSLLCRTVAENLPGGYACTQDGKPVRAYVEVKVCALDASMRDNPPQLIERVELSFSRI